MPGRPLMIMGCTSDAGKSFLVTALCRYFANQGLRVAPFKAQNMSNNAAVTSEGLEIGRAQYLQALAARCLPQARMNPVLLKPSAETYSQVIVLGRYDPAISALPWLDRKPYLWPVVRDALQSLLAEYDRVVIEGAGSPAEINLRTSDIVNMRVALECQADVYLVADIDRGGAFAHLLGTWSALEPDEQKLIKGFILNKFRGDPALLGNAMDWLKERTGVSTVALFPYIRHSLPEEDAFHYQAEFKPQALNIALLAYPYASNLDEFDPLIHTPGINLVPVREFSRLTAYHAVILPGSKNTSDSLRFLRQTGLAAEVTRAAHSGIPVLGICGGLQILGQNLHDPQGLESSNPSQPGLGLLDLITTLQPAKTTRQREVSWHGGLLRGYEIHHGETTEGPLVERYLPEGLGWQQGNVWGVYLHGLFENGLFRQQFLGRLGWQGNADSKLERADWQEVVDAEIERVAGLITASGWQS
ncbi:MAG TPA: cobyric acid synthase [Chloroflexia bacterium]|nr:cobyric acid synthase [Chloroflexia bacterium]